MGILRFLLAISVLLSHSESIWGFKLIDSFVAVQCFFMISGFYMALILSDKYHTSTVKGYMLFLSNRLMRIYPVYWVVLGITFLFLLIGYSILNYSPLIDRYIELSKTGNYLEIIFMAASNIFIIGQDLMMFLARDVSSGSVYFTANFANEQLPLARFLLVPQAWSLSIEIVFYIICPFLIRLKSKYLYLILAVSIILRLLLYYKGYNHDPWTYRLFPLELAYFLLGILAFRIYTFITIKSVWPFVVILISTFIYRFIESEFCFILYEVVFFFMLPYVFNYFKQLKWDGFIGEFSYPIYIVHILIRRIIDVMDNYFPMEDYEEGGLTLMLSILTSYLLIVGVIRPVDRWRSKRIVKAI